MATQEQINRFKALREMAMAILAKAPQTIREKLTKLVHELKGTNKTKRQMFDAIRIEQGLNKQEERILESIMILKF